VPSPNIWAHPQLYEIENRAADPHGHLAAAVASVYDVTGRDVLDQRRREEVVGWAAHLDQHHPVVALDGYDQRGLPALPL